MTPKTLKQIYSQGGNKPFIARKVAQTTEFGCVIDIGTLVWVEYLFTDDGVNFCQCRVDGKKRDVVDTCGWVEVDDCMWFGFNMCIFPTSNLVNKLTESVPNDVKSVLIAFEKISRMSSKSRNQFFDIYNCRTSRPKNRKGK